MAAFVFGAAALLPVCLILRHLTIGRALPNRRYPKMADDLSDVYMSLFGLLFFVFVSAVLFSLPHFQQKLGRRAGFAVWLLFGAGLAVGIVAMLAWGTGANGFLD